VTSEELLAHVEQRLAESRKQDADIRHEKNKAIDRAFEGFSMRLTDLEQACQSVEETTGKTKATTDRLFSLLQGDPELRAPGFLERQDNALAEINGKLSALESDKAESRTHRTNHADIPARVTKLEQDAHDQGIRLEAYKNSGRWGWIILSAVWGIIAAAWHFFAGKAGS
jgi:hypothetical protein